LAKLSNILHQIIKWGKQPNKQPPKLRLAEYVVNGKLTILDHESKMLCSANRR